TVFNNHGLLRVEQGRFGLGGEGLHTGEFHLASPDSTMLLGGVHSFLPSARITGPGATTVHRTASITGLLNVESDLVYDSYTGDVAPALDVGGALILDFDTDVVDFRSLVRAQRVSGSLSRALRFHAAADVAFDEPIGSAEFLAPAVVRGDLT